jgi:putative DNA primase/helicase
METQKQNKTMGLREYTDLFVNHHNFIYDGEDFFKYNDNIGLWDKVHDNETEIPHKEEAEANYAQKIKDLIVPDSLERQLSCVFSMLDQLEKRKYNLINVQNGVLDIRTKKLLPHKNEYYCRTQIPVKYQPGADAPRFKRIIEEIFRNDSGKIQAIQEFIGCILFPRILVEKGLLLLGTEMEGKSGRDVLIHILSKLIGQENIATLNISDFSNLDNLLVIRNKLLNIAYSIPKETCFATDSFEAMVSEKIMEVGRDSIKGGALFRPITKHIFLMNDIPVIIHKNSSLAQKLIIVKLNQRFTGSVADVFPEDKLSEELPGIFNWALEGLSRVNKYNKIICSEQMENEKWDLLNKN